MSEIACCYYYDEQRNRCNCYVNENLDELLVENAKLREQSKRLFDKALELATENAKLRELCEEQLDNLMPEICAKAWWCEDKDWHTCNDDACGNYTFVILARELGIEVTE